MNKMQIFAKALLEQIEVARVRQLSGLQESFNAKHADTARAISIFQKYVGLDQTGLPDPKTMSTIKMVVEQDAPPAGAPPAGAPPAGAPPAGAPPAKAPAAPAAPAAAKSKPKPVFNKSVQDLQNQLIAKGAKIKADGFMGPATQAAMKQFGAKGPASGANPAEAPPNPDANEYQIAQGQAGAAPKPPAPAPAPAPAGDGGVDPYVSNGTSTVAPPTTQLSQSQQNLINAGMGGEEMRTQAEIDHSKGLADVPSNPNAGLTPDDPRWKGPKPAAPAAATPKAPPGPQIVGDDDGNSTITNPDGSSMVVGPDGKQIMPGSNPNLPQNQGAFNKLGNWLTNKGQYQKAGGYQPPPGATPAAKPAATTSGPPDMGISGESFNRSNQRMVEDPELTAMLRIAGLR